MMLKQVFCCFLLYVDGLLDSRVAVCSERDRAVFMISTLGGGKVRFTCFFIRASEEFHSIE